MGNATSFVHLRSTGWWYCNRLLGVDRGCHRYDIRVHLFGGNGVDVSCTGITGEEQMLMATFYRFPTAGGS